MAGSGKPTNDSLIRMGDVPRIVLEMTGVLRKVDTVRKWTTVGVKGYDGCRLRLQTCNRLKSVFTTKQWIEEFLSKI